MFEDDIKKYYDEMAPSEKKQSELIAKVKAQKNRRALIRLTLQSICSAAACFLLAVGINYVTSSEAVQTADKNIGTVMAQPNGYILAGIVFILLLTVFFGRYIAKKHKDKRK